MRILVLGLVFITAVQGKPLNEDEKGNFKYPGGSIPGNFLEAREPDSLNGIYNKGGLGIGKTKREDLATTTPEKPGGDTQQNNINQLSSTMQTLQNQFNTFGGGNNMFILNKKKPKTAMRSDKPGESKPEGGSGGSGSGGNPFGQFASQGQNLLQSMNGGIPGMGGKPEEGSSGNGGSGNPMGGMTQVSEQFQNAIQGMGTGNMPFMQSGTSKRSEESKPEGGSGGSGSGGNPFGQFASQGQNILQSMNGGIPGMGGKPEGGSSGSGGSGNPIGGMNQVSEQFQNAIQGMGTSNMPFMQSGKSKRSEESKPEGGSGGGGNPFGQFASQGQNLLQSMNGGIPGMGGKPEEGSSGSGGSGNPMGGMSQVSEQFQNAIQGMGTSNMPFMQSGKSKRSEESKPEGGSGGGGNPFGQFASQGQNLLQSMNGGIPGMGGKPEGGSSGSGGSGSPMGGMTQVSEQFQNAIQGMGTSNMPFMQSGKSKRSEESKPEGGSGGGGNPFGQFASQGQNLLQSMNGGIPGMGGKPEGGSSGSGGSGSPMGGMTQVSEQFQNAIQGMGTSNMPFMQSGKSKRSEESKPEGGSGGGGNPFGQFASQGQNLLQSMNGGIPGMGGKPEGGSSGSGGSGSPMGGMTQVSEQFQNAIQGMGTSNMPFMQSGKSKRSEESKPEGGSGGGGNPFGQFASQGQNLLQSMNGGIPGMGGKPEGGSSGSGGSGSPMGGMTQVSEQFQNAIQGMGTSNMPFMQSGKSKRSEESKPEGGSGGGGNPFGQFASQGQNLLQSMNGGIPGMGGKPEGGSSGSGGSGSPMGGMTQVSEQFQNAIQGMGTSNMPFMQSGKSKRSEESKPEGGSGGGGNPFGQFASQGQNLLQSMNGGIPGMGGKPEGGSSGSGGSGSPMGGMTQVSEQFQNAIQGMGTSNMPFMQSGKSKRSEDSKPEGGSGGGGNPFGQFASQGQNLLQSMNGGIPGMGGKPEGGSSGSGGSGSPMGGMTQVSEQFQNAIQGMGTSNMPFMQSGKSKRSEESKPEGGSGGGGNPFGQFASQGQNLLQSMNGGIPGMGGKPEGGSSGSGGSGSPMGGMTQVSEQFQNAIQGMGTSNMPFMQSGKSKRSEESKPEGGSGGGGNPFGQFASQGQNILQSMNGGIPGMGGKPEGGSSGSGGSGNPMGGMTQVSEQFQNAIQGMGTSNMPFMPSGKSKRSEESKPEGGSGGGGNPFGQFASQGQSVLQSMNGGIPGMGGKPEEGSSGSGGSGNPMGGMTQVSEQFQNVFQGMGGK